MSEEGPSRRCWRRGHGNSGLVSFNENDNGEEEDEEKEEDGGTEFDELVEGTAALVRTGAGVGTCRGASCGSSVHYGRYDVVTTAWQQKALTATTTARSGKHDEEHDDE